MGNTQAQLRRWVRKRRDVTRGGRGCWRSAGDTRGAAHKRRLAAVSYRV